jgi:hypothetical protein
LQLPSWSEQEEVFFHMWHLRPFMMMGMLGAYAPAVGGSGSPPSYVNNGGLTVATSVHTGTLPSSRVNNNLLLFYFKVRSTTNDPTLSAGWTLLDSFGYGGSTHRYGVAYCLVTGSEAAPTLTWAGGGTCLSLIAQYSGVDQTTPVVAGSKNGASTGTTITTSAITSSKNQSLAVNVDWADAATAPTLPSGFANEGAGFYQNAFGSARLCDAAITTSGSGSAAVSCTQSSNVNWSAFLFEIRST